MAEGMTEAEHQTTLFDWASLRLGKHPELKLLHHIPNGGGRSKAEGGRLKAQGVKAGVPDICLPVSRRGYHGLCIELKLPEEKRKKNGGLRTEQIRWLTELNTQGYYARCCHGWDAARTLIEWYLEGQA